MEATVSQLLTAAKELKEDYGWVSENLVERRLRVPQSLATWLLRHLT